MTNRDEYNTLLYTWLKRVQSYNRKSIPGSVTSTGYIITKRRVQCFAVYTADLALTAPRRVPSYKTTTWHSRCLSKWRSQSNDCWIYVDLFKCSLSKQVTPWIYIAQWRLTNETSHRYLLLYAYRDSNHYDITAKPLLVLLLWRRFRLWSDTRTIQFWNKNW